MYANAARGMLSLMVSVSSPCTLEEEHVEIEGGDHVDLLVAWLHEILFRFYARQRVFTDVRVEAVKESRLSATLTGEPFDPSRHQALAEIKAATYHAARVEREGEQWVAEIFLDV